MSNLARIALGTVQEHVDHTAILWALLDVLELSGHRVQTFLARSQFVPRDGSVAITGQSTRHLDSWLMPRNVCQEIFQWGTRSCDLTIVEGQFDAARAAPEQGGSLDTLCDWLDLPRVVVLDASRLSPCCLPPRPQRTEAVLLDRVANEAAGYQLQTTIEAIWRVPVIGMLGHHPNIRAEVSRLRPGSVPSRELCHKLGQALVTGFRRDRLLHIASLRRPLERSLHIFTRQSTKRITVAIAFDDAYNCYFPDTLELLELHGANICTFSPLQDERLPTGTDLVYFGCGHAQRYAQALSENHCMKQSLRSHVCRGGRIYAEGCGLAYLAQQVEMHNGRRLMMSGVLPAIATLNPHARSAEPVELTMAQDNWLGEASTRVRGYLNSHWSLQPTGPLASFALEPSHRYDLVGYRQVIGSRLHLNFAAHPSFLGSFFKPHTKQPIPVL